MLTISSEYNVRRRSMTETDFRQRLLTLNFISGAQRTQGHRPTLVKVGTNVRLLYNVKDHIKENGLLAVELYDRAARRRAYR